MKTTIFKTYKDGVLLGFDSVYKDLTTQRKFENAKKKHIEKIKHLGNCKIIIESFFS